MKGMMRLKLRAIMTKATGKRAMRNKGRSTLLAMNGIWNSKRFNPFYIKKLRQQESCPRNNCVSSSLGAVTLCLARTYLPKVITIQFLKYSNQLLYQHHHVPKESGLSEIVGVDFSSSLIEQVKRRAKSLNLQHKLKYRVVSAFAACMPAFFIYPSIIFAIHFIGGCAKP